MVVASTLQFTAACHRERSDSATEASPLRGTPPAQNSAQPTPSLAVDSSPNASFDPGLANDAPPAAVRGNDEALRGALTPVLTPKSRRHPKNKPGKLEATRAEGFCYDMYSACTEGRPSSCTSAPYSLNCGVTGLVPTGDWMTCVCH